MKQENRFPRIRPASPRAGGQTRGWMPVWLITYSDLVTLLLTFFILMMSMAELDQDRFTRASQSLRDAFGIQARPTRVEVGPSILPERSEAPYQPIPAEQVNLIRQTVVEQLETIGLDDMVEIVVTDPETIVLRVNETVLFSPEDDELRPEAAPVLRHLARIINPLPAALRIEGHTDDREGSAGRFTDDWELSVARALAVTRFFKQHELLSLDRLAAIGYGSARPIAPNDSEPNRIRNRRVEFVLDVHLPSGTGRASDTRTRIPL